MEETLVLVGIVLITSGICGLISVLLVLWNIRRVMEQINEQIANVKGMVAEEEDQND